jgi:hypothetical protein
MAVTCAEARKVPLAGSRLIRIGSSGVRLREPRSMAATDSERAWPPGLRAAVLKAVRLKPYAAPPARLPGGEFVPPGPLRVPRGDF